MKGLRSFVRGGAPKRTHRAFVASSAVDAPTYQGLASPDLDNSNFVDGETPAGAVNGVNDTFALSDEPSPAASLRLYLNGVLQRPGTHFTLSGSTITYSAGFLPQTGDVHAAFFRR